MDKSCCFCLGTEDLVNILPCEHLLCAGCVLNSEGDVKCWSSTCGSKPSPAPRLQESPQRQRSLPHSHSEPASLGPSARLDEELAGLLAEIPQLKQSVQRLINQHRRGRQSMGQEVQVVKRKLNQSAQMAEKNINHRTQKLMEQVEETELKRKLGIVSLMDDTSDNKGALKLISLLAVALAEDDSDDFATVALGDELITALTLVQVNTLQLEFDDDISGLGLEFAERPQDASVGTLVRKQNCIGITTLDNGEFLLAVDQRSNGGVCLGRAKKTETEDVRWILAFQPLDIIAPVILGSFSATQQTKEQNIFLAVGREVFSVNIDRLFSASTVASSTSVRNYRLNFLHQDARITAIDWYPSSPNHVMIANDKSEVLHVVDVVTSSILKEIRPKVAFPAANCLMTIKINGVMQVAIASEASKKAAMIAEDGRVLFYFKKPSEVSGGQSPTACLPRYVFLSTVVELIIIRQSKIGVMWVDEEKGKPPIYVLYDTDDGTWRRIFSLDEKVPTGVTYIPPDQLAFCFDSARVQISGFDEK